MPPFNQFIIHFVADNVPSDATTLFPLSCFRFLSIGSISNHDDDDVNYTRRDWDENVAFGGKMKLKQ